MSNLATNRPDSVQVLVVDSGTIVEDNRVGKRVIVDDNTIAHMSGVIYCTEKHFNALKHLTRPAE